MALSMQGSEGPQSDFAAERCQKPQDMLPETHVHIQIGSRFGSTAMPGKLSLALCIQHVVLYLPGKQRPCCMYCTAHIGQVRSAADVAVQLGLLVTYVMESDISSPNPSKAYTAQSVCSPAGKDIQQL